ncbi:MAG: response regulator transcription factor [Anaerolineae bacterium]|nr:response regulator transcription factor [Anaerolineae bacterium]
MGYILVVDDDEDVLTSIVQVLEEADYTVKSASGGQAALDLIARQLPDLVVLDILMPEMDGLEVCRRIRADPFTSKLPVIFLTARGRATDIVQGLDTGGDDYLTKPFEVIELPARIRALLRRAPGGQLEAGEEYLTVGELKIHLKLTEVHVGDRLIELTPVEHRLLHCLMVHAGQPVSIDQLLQEVWGYPPGVGDPNLVHVHIVKLRGKVEPDSEQPQIIRNLRGRGYVV